MSAADWFPVEPGRYLKNTMHLTTRQHGGYWLLILAALENDGDLPGSDLALASIAKMDAKAWKEDGSTLKAFLTWADDHWVHEYAAFVCQQAQLRIDAKSIAGKMGAAKRWQGRANGKPIAVPSDSHRQTDAHLQLQLQGNETTTPTVSPNARERASQPGRASLIRDDWQPSEIAVAQLRKGRPDLVGAFFDQRMLDFRLWCRDKAVMSHDHEAAWLGFMGKSRAAPKASDDDEVEAALQRSKQFGQPGYRLGG